MFWAARAFQRVDQQDESGKSVLDSNLRSREGRMFTIFPRVMGGFHPCTAWYALIFNSVKSSKTGR
jgi:hypothetical protein